ncbi:MAG: sulfurtransferase [Armatimonadetes bacterium]|nr:sulfurtransferase [Armatimonadota bacterium]
MDPAFQRLVADAKTRIHEISAEEVRAKQEAREHFHLIDVREDQEWARGRAAGAKHLGRGVLERDIETTIPGLDAPIVLYCGGGYRSALAADSLRLMGYTAVSSLAGGWKRWRELGYPTEGADERPRHPPGGLWP